MTNHPSIEDMRDALRDHTTLDVDTLENGILFSLYFVWRQYTNERNPQHVRDTFQTLFVWTENGTESMQQKQEALEREVERLYDLLDKSEGYNWVAGTGD